MFIPIILRVSGCDRWIREFTAGRGKRGRRGGKGGNGVRDGVVAWRGGRTRGRKVGGREVRGRGGEVRRGDGGGGDVAAGGGGRGGGGPGSVSTKMITITTHVFVKNKRNKKNGITKMSQLRDYKKEEIGEKENTGR